ncbi:MAG: oligosaccharide flippase family protein [Gammaproteobacteria bacterium]|nr:oligosaccharide flippase family protein [Gammaproteobacteria bacterium]
MLRKLFKHSSNYTIGSLIATIAGLVSFPILTRTLTTEEYGLMGYIGTTLATLVCIGKLGVQHATVRFYAEVRAGKRDVGLGEYYSTVIFGMAAMGLAVTVVWATITQLLPHWFYDSRLPALLLLTSSLIIIRVVDSGLVNQLRAQQRSAIFAFYQVVKRYVGLGLVLLALFFVSKNLWGFYGATIVGELVAAICLGAWLVRGVEFRPKNFSPELFRAMLVFGIPMIGYEFAGIILQQGDRYVIIAVLGAEKLGIYSAAYNMCEYIQLCFIMSFSQAIVPIYVRLWEEKGETATVEFLQKFVHYYVMLALPIVAGLIAIGADLLSFLASEKYVDGAVIIPYVVAGMVFDGAIVIAGAGLYIHKRTKTILMVIAACAVFNLVLNFALVPVWGIRGSAVATLVSYAVLISSVLVFGRRWLRFPFPWAAVLKFAPLAAIMYFAVIHVELGSGLENLFARVAVGAVVYVGLVLAADSNARDALQAVWARIRNRSA